MIVRFICILKITALLAFSSIVFSGTLDMFLMQDIEDTNKDLVSYLAGESRYSAIESLTEIEAMYRDLELHFSNRKDGKDGMEIVQKSVLIFGQMRLYTESGMYKSALDLSEDISNQCKMCHSLYK